jgi:ABC-2 type transport system ATP-binding protein
MLTARNAGRAVIAAEGLVKRFGKVTALDGVDLRVAEGTVLGLLGPNGSGKTTVVRILTTLLGPDAGHATIAGIDVVAQPGTVRPLIGMAGQYAAVDPNLTGRENLIMVARLASLPRALARARAGELLDQFDLTEVAGRPSRTYSGGLRRRLDLAAALVHQPAVLFFDEPTTGLDPRSRRGLWAVIERLVAGGATVLLTTQYLEEADHLADQVVVLDRGKVIASGTPAELKASLGTSVFEARFPDEPTAIRAARSLTGGLHPSVHGERLEIAVTAGSDTSLDILTALRAADLHPSSFALRDPSLDDVFIELTGQPATHDDTTTEASPR